jgi:hypothetical protein
MFIRFCFGRWGNKYSVLSTRYSEEAKQCLALTRRCSVLSTQYSVLSTQKQPSSIEYCVLSTDLQIAAFVAAIRPFRIRPSSDACSKSAFASLFSR